MLLLAASVCGQDSQFTFDPNGNLESQTPVSASAPIILAQPQPQVVKPGELASFLVVARDTRGLTYQWRTNGVNLSCVRNDALLLASVSVSNPNAPGTIRR
jgi:hypothetical protein